MSRQQRAFVPGTLETINSEVLSLTYGALVRQLVDDLGDVERVNEQLDKIGHNIGARIVDEFLARSGTERCASFREAMEAVSAGLRMFLGVQAQVGAMTAEGTECSVAFDTNPLADFAEVPPHLNGLRFSQLLCGAIRGSLEAVNVRVECHFERDMLAGDTNYSVRVRLLAHQPEEYPFKSDE